jgi:multisubunit Na+/H+ antiporter MnhF subunit
VLRDAERILRGPRFDDEVVGIDFQLGASGDQ